MRANKFGAFAYNYSYDAYKKICSATVGATEMSMINKWGEEEGKRRWANYCEAQATTNSFEYKQEKYGWDKAKFDEFNKGRAVTEELCIARHGNEEGLKIWEEYKAKQRYTNTLEYFINRYGVEEGTNRYNNFWSGTHFIGFRYSKISQKCFDKIMNTVKEKYSGLDDDNILYATHKGEYNNTFIRLFICC